MKNNLRVERAILNITQAELAEKLGVSRQTVHAIENEKYIPSALLVLKVAKIFNKPVEAIFSLEEGEEPG